jgi:chromosome segregation ATPase
MAALAYAALVAIDATARRGGEQDLLPDPRTLQDPAAKRAVQALLEARRELADVLRRSPDQIQRYTQLALGAVPELEQHAAQLVSRAEELGGYLGSVSAESVRRDVKQLAAQAEQATDASAREQFQQARVAREDQLRTLQELAEARQRLEGHLSRLVATYQSLPARVVHLRTLDAQAADALSGDVNQELDRMNQEISVFEQTLKDLSVRVPA